MLPQTHRQIGRMVNKIIEKDLNVQLRSISLEYGSVKPDISPKYKSVQHTIDGSFHMVQGLINDIFNRPIPTTKKELRKFCVELGVVLHFISDYFCQAHNTRIPLRHHYMYERRLAKRFSKADWADNYISLYHYPSHSRLDSTEALVDFIKSTHTKYMFTPKRISNDIFNCVDTCATISQAIIRNVFVEIAASDEMLTG